MKCATRTLWLSLIVLASHNAFGQQVSYYYCITHGRSATTKKPTYFYTDVFSTAANGFDVSKSWGDYQRLVLTKVNGPNDPDAGCGVKCIPTAKGTTITQDSPIFAGVRSGNHYELVHVDWKYGTPLPPGVSDAFAAGIPSP